MDKSFIIQKEKFGLRAGILRLPHGAIETPVFMPIATRGAVRVAPFSILRELGAQIVLANTYHLITRPGVDLIEKNGGLHEFIGWKKPLLTDSGGFQVFSLAANRLVDDDGVAFRSLFDGAKIKLSPESVVDAQYRFGSDISMVLDEVCALPATDDELQKALERTTAWAERAKEKFSELIRVEPLKGSTLIRPLLFGIVQGGINEPMRVQSATELTQIDFDGYAIGGLSVGEGAADMYRTIEATMPFLPLDKPRYLMGVGEPENIVEAVRRGVDMFDCVLPTRNARHALLYGNLNKEYLREILQSPIEQKVQATKLYKKIHISNSQFANDRRLVNESCAPLSGVSFNYLRYLFQIKDPMSPYLATLNNLWFYLELMRIIRNNILE